MLIANDEPLIELPPPEPDDVLRRIGENIEAVGRRQDTSETVMEHITVANVACGFHASDP